MTTGNDAQDGASYEASFAQLPESEPRPPDSPLALQGIRVIDFSHYLAGPFATTILADLGAEVIKVESPKGDDFRELAPHHSALKRRGAPFLWANRNKRSIALDLKTSDGLDIARELVKTADVLVENFSTGVMERLGLGYESCRGMNPRLVYCSVSAYGRTGTFAQRPGFDPIVQAESGFMSMNGYADRPGVRSAASVMDVGTALMASNAILAALFARQATGKGQRADIALFDTAITMDGYTTMQAMFGMKQDRVGNISPDSSPTGVFHAQDKSFYMSAGSDANFKRLCGLIGRPELPEDPRFRTRPDRIRQRETLTAIVNEVFGQQPWAYWQPRLQEVRIPNGEVRSMDDALASQEVRERGLVTRVHDPVAGWLPNVPLPIRLSETPLADPHPAPAIGEHTADILTDVLGYSSEQVESLLRKGGVGRQGH